jgi:rubrerythrin
MAHEQSDVECRSVTKTLLNIRRSIREEQAAIDAYLERSHHAAGDGHLTVAELYDHIRPEEEQHLQELQAVEKVFAGIGLRGSCPLVRIMYPKGGTNG